MLFSSATDDALVEVIGQMHGVSNAAMRQLLDAVVVMDQREAFRVDGAGSMAMWLTMRHGVSGSTAMEWVRVARGLVFCPTAADLFEDGHLSWDQLRSVVDLVAFAAGDQDDVALDAVGRTAAELDRLAREARKVSREESVERLNERRLQMRWENGGLRFYGWLPDVEGKAFQQVIERGADQQPDNPELDRMQPIAQRRADALMDLVATEIAQDADPDRATVVLHVNAEILGNGNDGLDLAALELGPLVSLATAHRLACDGRCQVVVDDLLGRTVEVAKTTHAVPRWLRRRVLHRDGGCRWPGCGRTALLHTHHIRWWTRDGGFTEEGNLVALCRFHHRLVHELGWEIEGDPIGRLRFISPRGRVLEIGPPGLRDDVRQQLGLRTSTDPPQQAA